MNNNKTKNLTINILEEDIYNEYGVDEHVVLQEELTSTIETLSNTQKLNDKLNLNFSVNKDVNVNEERFVEAYKNTFKMNIQMKKHELSRCITTGIAILVIGIILLALNVFVLENLEKFTFALFDVISWVFVWAGVETLTLELIQIVIEIKKSRKLLNANLTFTKKQ